VFAILLMMSLMLNPLDASPVIKVRRRFGRVVVRVVPALFARTILSFLRVS